MTTAAPLLKSPHEIGLLREAGRVARFALDAAMAAVRPGVTTAEVDAVAEHVIRAHGATPEFKGYQGFPAATCISIGEQVVHGIPGNRVVRPGDLVAIDVGARLEGYVGDNAATVAVEPAPEAVLRLNRAGRECLEKAIAACVVGARLSDVGRAIQGHAEACGYSVVRDYAGHGIGAQMHEEPEISNFVDASVLARDLVLEVGMCLALEPMLIAGGAEVDVLGDGWTVVTRDGSPSVHWEDVVAVTADGPRVLTRQ